MVKKATVVDSDEKHDMEVSERGSSRVVSSQYFVNIFTCRKPKIWSRRPKKQTVTRNKT